MDMELILILINHNSMWIIKDGSVLHSLKDKLEIFSCLVSELLSRPNLKQKLFSFHIANDPSSSALLLIRTKEMNGRWADKIKLFK